MFLYGYGVNGLARVSVSVVVAVVMLLFGASVHADWEFQESGVTDYLTDIYFVDEHHGWAVGYNATIIATSDGGETWVRQECPVENYAFMGVEFYNENVGYCIGHDGSSENPTYKGIILFTRDGGLTWEPRTVPDDTIKAYRDLTVVDEMTCWVTASLVGAKGKIFHTSDGGITWECQYSSLDKPHQYLFYGIDFIDNNTGWTLGGIFSDPYDHTYLYGTVNGGDDWIEIGEVSELRQKKIYALNKDVLWTCDHLVHISSDGGAKWSLRYQRYQDAIRDVYPLDNRKAFVLMSNSLVYTDDGGTTFETVATDSTSHFSSMAGIGGRHVWCLKFDGRIYKYTDDRTSVRNTVRHPSEMKVTAFPNPFNSSTMLTFSLEKRDQVQLSVYDVLGRRVAVLVDEEISSGKHLYRWNSATSASGLYFAVLKTSAGEGTKKMLLLR